MRFVSGMDVLSPQGEKIGTLSNVVIDVKTREVTDIVVERGLLGGNEKVIPVDALDLATEDHVQLLETDQSVDDFQDYKTSHYVPTDAAESSYEQVRASYWYPPTDLARPVPREGGFLPGTRQDSVPITSLPDEHVAVAKGAQVYSSDEQHLGNVEEVIVNSENNQLSHFVIGKGFLFKEHKLVPAHWVNTVNEDKIYLSVEARLFERLPDYRLD